MKIKSKTVLAFVAAAACVSLSTGGCSSSADNKSDQMEGGSGVQPAKGLPPGGESPNKPPTKPPSK